MKLALPYIFACLILLVVGIRLDSEWLAVAAVVGAGHGSYLIHRTVRGSRRTGKLPE